MTCLRAHDERTQLTVSLDTHCESTELRFTFVMCLAFLVLRAIIHSPHFNSNFIDSFGVWKIYNIIYGYMSAEHHRIADYLFETNECTKLREDDANRRSTVYIYTWIWDEPKKGTHSLKENIIWCCRVCIYYIFNRFRVDDSFQVWIDYFNRDTLTHDTELISMGTTHRHNRKRCLEHNINMFTFICSCVVPFAFIFN